MNEREPLWWGDFISDLRKWNPAEDRIIIKKGRKMNDDIDYKGVADYQKGYQDGVKDGAKQVLEELSRIIADRHEDLRWLESVCKSQAD